MHIEHKGKPPYYEFKLSESVLTIEEHELDLEQLRADIEVVIDLKDENGNFIANVIIPPNEYELVDTGKTDEQGNPVYEQKLKPLNIDKLRLILWSKIETPETDVSEKLNQEEV